MKMIVMHVFIYPFCYNFLNNFWNKWEIWYRSIILEYFWIQGRLFEQRLDQGMLKRWRKFSRGYWKIHKFCYYRMQRIETFFEEASWQWIKWTRGVLSWSQDDKNFFFICWVEAIKKYRALWRLDISDDIKIGTSADLKADCFNLRHEEGCKRFSQIESCDGSTGGCFWCNKLFTIPKSFFWSPELLWISEV